MERNRVSSNIIRKIEMDILHLFPIIQFVFAIGIMVDLAISGPLSNSTARTLLSFGDWAIVLLVLSGLGFFSLKNFYIYYFSVCLPLQILSVDMYSAFSNGNEITTQTVLMTITFAIASAVFAGKIIPRKHIWIL